MKVISEVVFHVLAHPVYEDMVEKYIESATINAERANNRRNARIKNSSDYENLITEPSQKGCASYISDDFISNSGLNKAEILEKHYKNSAEGYKKYQEKLAHMFETVDGIPAKRYKEAIKRGAMHYGKNVAQKLLAFTGDKVHGLGCASMAIRWLDGDSGVKQTSTITLGKGKAIIIPKPGLNGPFRTALNSRLVQAGAVITRSGFKAPIMKRQNDITNDLMNSFANPALNLVPFETGGDSHVDYMTEGADDDFIYRLSIKVSQK